MLADIVLVVCLGFRQEQLGHVVVCELRQLDTPLQYSLAIPRSFWWSSVGHSIVHLGQLMHDFRLLVSMSDVV